MSQLRFFQLTDFKLERTFPLSKENSHKALKVLRLKLNDHLYLFNNTGIEYYAKITAITKSIIDVTIIDQNTISTESTLPIALGQAITKSSKMDFIIQKATELGAHSITPLITDHTIAKPAADKAATKVNHWQQIAIAACCQCGRNIVPTINPITTIGIWHTQLTTSNKFILSPTATHKLTSTTAISDAALLIGPEGGFSHQELAMAQDLQFSPITLGPRILRAETATIVALSLMQAYFGDL